MTPANSRAVNTQATTRRIGGLPVALVDRGDLLPRLRHEILLSVEPLRGGPPGRRDLHRADRESATQVALASPGS